MIVVALVAWLALAAATPAPGSSRAPGAAPRKTRAVARRAKPKAAAAKVAPRQQASDACALEELGAYSEVVRRLRALRHDVAPDADLELALALNEARTGELDSAAARLAGPLLTRALADTLPLTRRVLYPWHRDPTWINGKFDGWHWYIARARVEVAASRGRWSEALEASRASIAANPLAGREWLIYALCAARTGDAAGAESAAHRAAYLDPELPEAFYLEGLLEWKAGRRTDAQASFRSAVALDSSWEAPAMALVRSRLPGTAPDSLPGTFLTGIRRVALITSPVRPKPEEFVQMDFGASVQEQKLLPLPDTLQARMKPVKLYLNVLVDEHGKPVLSDLPWFPAGQFPEEALHLTLASVPHWVFRPGVRLGSPHAVWTTLQLTYDPQTSNR